MPVAEPGRVFTPTLLITRRAALGLSSKDLAERAGLSYRNLRRIELGQRPRPWGTTLAKLAAALDCGIDDLTAPARDATAA